MAKKKNKGGLLASRRFKYGSSAVIFTVVFVAVIVAFNVIFTSLAQTYLWYGDMTDEQIYDVSQAAVDLIGDLNDTNIEIIFCTPFDKCEENVYLKQVLTCAQNFEKEFDFITVSYRDIITHPTSVDQYRTTEATNIKTTNVIITNGSDYRVHTIESFYVFAESDNSVFAFNGEYKMCSAILQMQGDNPIAYFTTGHGETISNQPLRDLFTDAGFIVKDIDLSKEDIDPAAKIVIINGPKYDFIGAYSDDGAALADSSNEIKKLDNFLDGFGSLMVFVDPETQDMPELEELLSEWGIAIGDAIIKDYANSISIDGTAIVSEYSTEETMGASLHSSLRSLESVPKTILRYARPIEISKTAANSGKNVSVVLYSSDDAQAYSTTDDAVVQTGDIPLMVLSTEMRYVDNEDMYTYVVACGTSQFGDATYLQSNSYGNKDIMFSLMKALGREKVPAEIDFKVFDDYSLDITTAESTRWTVIFTLVIPMIAAVGGIVVYVRRRHL